MRDLIRRLERQLTENGESGLCQGTLLSHTEYTADMDLWKYRDARLLPDALVNVSTMTP